MLLTISIIWISNCRARTIVS